MKTMNLTPTEKPPIKTTTGRATYSCRLKPAFRKEVGHFQVEYEYGVFSDLIEDALVFFMNAKEKECAKAESNTA